MSEELLKEPCASAQKVQNERHETRKDEIQEIKNALRRYEVMFGSAGPVDTFWESFNSSRCKTAMLLISVLFTVGYIYTVIAQIPNEEMTVLMMGIIGFWSGRSSKSKDNIIRNDNN